MENQKQFIDALVTRQSVITAVENVKTTSTMAGDVAISRGTATYMVGSAAVGTSTKTDLTLLLIWQKRGGEWRLLARQAFKV